MHYAPLFEDKKVHTVSEITAQIKQLVEDGFASIWVAGEISKLTLASSGHRYFNLKDNRAVLRAVIWSSDGRRLRFALKDGMEVVARGNLSVYPARGDYQLVIQEIEPKGVGAQELALRQLKEKLAARGYFAPERKQALPRFPQRIALVTSPTGAAVRDMLEILGRRWPAAEVWVCPVRVQGEGAAEAMAATLRFLNRLAGVDVAILGRGGGSAEDLDAFNTETVAQAIFESRVPVVSAVGHEIDVTIADLVADRRALTPSEAAELVTPNRQRLLEDLRYAGNHLADLARQRLDVAWQRLRGWADRPALRNPLEPIRDHQRRLDEWHERLQRVIAQHLDRARQEINASAARLQTLSPLNVLTRGYSLTRREADQLVVRSPDQVQRGDRVVTYLRHGRLVSRVEEAAETPDPWQAARDQ